MGSYLVLIVFKKKIIIAIYVLLKLFDHLFLWLQIHLRLAKIGSNVY